MDTRRSQPELTAAERAAAVAWFGAVVPLAVALVLGLASLRSPSLGRTIVQTLASVVGVVSLALALLMAIEARFRQRDTPSRVRRAPLVLRPGTPLAIGGLLLAAYCVVNGRVPIELQVELQQSQAWCEAYVTRLEAHRGATGRYPEALTELGELPTPPPLSTHFWSDADSYMFEIEDPRTFHVWGGWHWTSDEPRWERHDD